MMATLVLTMLFAASAVTCLFGSWATYVGGGGLGGFTQTLLLVGLFCLLLAVWGVYDMEHVVKSCW